MIFSDSLSALQALEKLKSEHPLLSLTGGRGLLMSPPVWNLRAVISFHFTLSSLVLLPSPITLSVSSFFWLLVHFPELFPENSSNNFR